MKRLFYSVLFSLALISCSQAPSSDSGQSASEQNKPKEKANNPKGIGEIKNVSLTNPLEEGMVSKGKAIYEMKCAACHKLDDKRVVGPGWLGVTKKRTPEWIMNMITNVDVMLDEDEAAYELLKECLVRMPNQNISIGDARDILEFMRRNDGEE